MGNKIRRIAPIVGLIMILCVQITAFATEENPQDAAAEARKKEEEAALSIPIETNKVENWPQGPIINGESGIVMDMDTGAVLYGKAVDEKHYPASITKILTALVALENSEMTDMVTFSEECQKCKKAGYAHIGMKPGERIKMKDALHGLMLASANEVAYAVGETVGGTHEDFVQMMNDRAAELGCENTHFINTNGMFEEEHYTTVRDMALISKAAFTYPALLEIVQTVQYTIPPTNLEEDSRTFQQGHKMLVSGKNHDDRCIAGKTGYTEESFNTLATVMEQDGKQIVVVIMASRKGTYEDTKKLGDYAFQNFKNINISDNEKSEEFENISPEDYVTVPNGVSFDELTKEIDENGEVSYFYNEHLVGTTKVSLKQEQPAEKKPVKEKEKEKDSTGFIIKLVIGAVIIASVLAAVVIVLYIKQEREHARKLREFKRRRRERQESENEEHGE